MEFEVSVSRYGAFEWKWQLYELKDGKRYSPRQRGFQPFKSWAILAAKWEANGIRRQKAYNKQGFSKKI